MLSTKDLIETKLGVPTPYRLGVDVFSGESRPLSLITQLELLKEAIAGVTHVIETPTVYTNPRFDPVVHGFRFDNNFRNIFYNWWGNIGTGGRCGGMSYSAKDYFKYSAYGVPTVDELPADGDVYGEWIFYRQDKSMHNTATQFVDGQINDVHRNALWGLSTPPIGNAFVGLMAEIDKDEPCNLGLLSTKFGADQLIKGKCHQILAIGYTLDPDPEKTLIHVYDPNYPKKEMVLLQNLGQGYWEQHFLVHLGAGRYGVGVECKKMWHSFFLDLAYLPETPPDPTTPTVTRDQSGWDLSRWGPPRVPWGVDYNNHDLRSYKFEGTNFSGNQALNRSDLEGVIAESAVFTGTDVSHSDFRKTKLNRATFQNADAKVSTFDGAELADASFRTANLTDAKFRDIKGVRADFGQTVLNKAFFNNAELDFASFYQAASEGVVFEHASLIGASFRQATFKSAYFCLPPPPAGGDPLGTARSDFISRRANLRNADFGSATLNYCHFVFSLCINAGFGNSALANCDFRGADLSLANFSGAALNSIDFRETNLSQTDFRDASLDSIDIRGVRNFQAALWTGASITNITVEDPAILAYIMSQI